MSRSIWQSIKRLFFVGRSVRIGSDFHIGVFSYVSAADSLSIGDKVYIGKFCTIQCSGRIGNGVLIANSVGIIGRRDHDYKSKGVLVSRSPWVGSDRKLAIHAANRIDISDDVWIGYGAVIFSGITVGRGSIISAGAVVSTDVDPYSIVAGNPARVVGVRFTPEEILSHEQGLCF